MVFHLVHVGKCGGESFIKALPRQISPLQVYHVGDSNELLARRILSRNTDDIFIVLLRDPVERFISAFEWDLYSKSLDNAGEILQNKIWARVYDTFRCANDLAESLSDQLDARRATAFFAMTASRLHVQFDLGWYLPPVIAAHLPARRTYLVRLETIESDMATFLSAHGLSSVPVSRTKDHYKHKLPPDRVTKELSDLARQNILNASHAALATRRILDTRLTSPESTVLD